jgi:enediyne biosynthesis protein E4
MMTPNQIPSMRAHRFSCATFSISTLMLSVAALHASASNPVYVLSTSQTGIATESVTAEGYPGQHNRMTGGICVADFNNDTYPDLFIPSLGINPNQLYINNQDGTFTEQAELWGVNQVHLGMGVAAADINNDGYMDLYVVSLGEPGLDGTAPGLCKMYLNSGPDIKGSHSFTDIAKASGINEVMELPAGMTPAFGDIDLDGDLDLFVATWRFNDTGNRLFENQFMQTGSPTFIDVTDASLSAPQRFDISRGFTPHIVDITGDRYPEILLTADFTTSELFVNNGVNESGRATFRTTTNKSNINADENGMGAAIADFNRDGLLDWYQTNIYVATESRGNTLYMCTSIDDQGDPIFLDQAAVRGVQDIGWGWGVVAGDFDNDTDPDLVATNGWPGWPNSPTKMWINDGNAIFSDTSILSGLFFNINGRGLVSLDYDKDGDLDLIFIDNQGPIRFYRNDLAIEDGFTNYLRVNLDTSTHPCLAPNGFGAKVIATVNGQTQLHATHNNASYLSQSELTTHIGLETATQLDQLEIQWADGSTTILNNIPANQEITVSAYHPTDLNQDTRLNYLDASQLLTAYRAQDPSADYNNDGIIEFQDVLDFLDAINNACQ